MDKLTWIETTLGGKTKVRIGLTPDQLRKYADNIDKDTFYSLSWAKFEFICTHYCELEGKLYYWNRDPHLCEWTNDNGQNRCDEEPDYRLVMSIPLDGFIMEVNACPNCGYKSKKVQ